MNLEDIPAAMRLKDEAGWNQTATDWTRFISASPKGCFVMENSGDIVGTSATITYEGLFSWIGMLVVDKRYRGQGIGTALLESAISFLDSQKIPTIKLDATPQGRPLYEKLGFMEEYDIERWVLNRTINRPVADGDPTILDDVLRMDKKIFGTDRSRLLCSLAQEAPHLVLIEQEEGEVTGYCFGRRGSHADHMGPWIAKNGDIAERILNAFILRSEREHVFVDCLRLSPWAIPVVKAYGFEFSRPLTRMYRGANRDTGQTEWLCASIGPEFG